MKKGLNVDDIANELKGGSAFFPDYKPKESPTPVEVTIKNAEPKKPYQLRWYHDTMTPRHHLIRMIALNLYDAK
jgi:hypothetical protein